MRDPLVFRIVGMFLVAIGALSIIFAHHNVSPLAAQICGGISAFLGTVLVVFSAFFRRGHEGLTTTAERRVGKPSAIKRIAFFWGGLFLVIISPLVGAIPGPGGLLVFAAGFGLMLRGSQQVKKLFARFKKRHPKKGEWADFGLQRLSYKRRQARAKAEALAGEVPEGDADLRKLEGACKN